MVYEFERVSWTEKATLLFCFLLVIMSSIIICFSYFVYSDVAVARFFLLPLCIGLILGTIILISVLTNMKHTSIVAKELYKDKFTKLVDCKVIGELGTYPPKVMSVVVDGVKYHYQLTTVFPKQDIIYLVNTERNQVIALVVDGDNYLAYQK